MMSHVQIDSVCLSVRYTDVVVRVCRGVAGLQSHVGAICLLDPVFPMDALPWLSRPIEQALNTSD